MLASLRSSTIEFCAKTRITSYSYPSLRCMSTVPSSSSDLQCDLAVVGGGIVGAATAYKISQLPRSKPLKILILEKENALAKHQTGRNSGVIHSGIYYKPGSLKAKMCVRGLDLMYDYCDKNHIPYIKTGKLIVAVEEEEIPRLLKLYENGKVNGVRDLQLIDEKGIKEHEPHCRGIKALLSPHTGIVDYSLVTKSLADSVARSGGETVLNFEVVKFQSAPEEGKVQLIASDGRVVHCKGAVVCGGLQSDRLAVLSNCPPTPKIVPFRGDYLQLKQGKRHLVRGNIYPVPDPRFPFLGVHFTPRMDGNLWLGPTAVFSMDREGYNMFSFRFRDMWEAVTFPGFLKMAARYTRFGLAEMWRNAYIPAQIKQLQRYIPEITTADVERAHSGNRAQALDSDGNLVDDFIIDTAEDELGKKVVHVRNAPSPAATSSLAIADHIVDTVSKKFKFLSA
ncbi:L-2-hydroxyglutarate dehydrogenase, mitochondrial-like [Paramacrobiotus metropolitanus]|uniref:L-2-hydroxyglutarate dehydrogenase, mitochondrial-like n=1 Tax=Paramacrobiotus metropolitanus TaxID=2943436 RepID=UPI002445BD63|nr:L-2-hydroxyglutarate dehydrogenase, mitochondrial-like [Paramacrobiotus metropolitanus]